MSFLRDSSALLQHFPSFSNGGMIQKLPTYRSYYHPTHPTVPGMYVLYLNGGKMAIDSVTNSSIVIRAVVVVVIRRYSYRRRGKGHVVTEGTSCETQQVLRYKIDFVINTTVHMPFRFNHGHRSSTPWPCTFTSGSRQWRTNDRRLATSVLAARMHTPRPP